MQGEELAKVSETSLASDTIGVLGQGFSIRYNFPRASIRKRANPPRN